jgi:photosystem II stability/assembly factor-like uncharacterized protein
LRFNWNAGFAQDPKNNSVAYYGSQFLHKTTDKGATWQIISPDLTTNNPEHQKQDYGGLTIDASGAEIYNSILSIAPSALDNQVIWVGTDDGNVQLTQNGGKTWSNLTLNIKGLPKESWIAQIRASRYNKAEAWLVANNYRKGDFNPYIYRTKDFGRTWERIVDATKVKGYALTVIQDPVEPKLVFAGTENGLWISIDEGKSWTQLRNGFPSVSTMDLAIQERESALIIGTFGRSIWILDDLLTMRTIAKSGIAKDFAAFPLNDAVQVKGIFIAPPGNIWTGFNTTFEGENRPFGEATIPFYVKVPASDKEKFRVTGQVFTDKNELIQNITSTKIDSGLNYIAWRLDEKISKLLGGWDDPESKGILALPGKYKVVLSYQGKKDSSYVNVIPDPRFDYSNEVEEAHYAILKRLDRATEKLSMTLSRLKESNETVEKILIQLKDIKTNEGEVLRQNSNAIKESIKRLTESATDSRPAKQVGAWTSFQVTAQSKISEAQQTLRARLFKPSAQDVQRVEIAEQLTKEFVEKTDAFFSKEWRDYRANVESAQLSWFK